MNNDFLKRRIHNVIVFSRYQLTRRDELGLSVLRAKISPEAEREAAENPNPTKYNWRIKYIRFIRSERDGD